MNYKIFFIILSLIIIPIVIYYLLKILYKENFTSNKPYKELILFTLDGCPHCDKMKPTWDLLKKNYGNNQYIKLIEVEGRNKPKLVELYNVNGFPTLLYVKDEKKQTEYNGDRSYEDLVKFLKHSMSN